MSAAVSITPILRSAFPTHTAKHAARCAGVSVRTVHGWLAERCQPSSAALLRMADRNDILRAELIARLALGNGYQNAKTAPGLLPLDGTTLPHARRPVDGPRAPLAQEG